LTAYLFINSLFKTYFLQKKSGTPSKRQDAAAVDDAGGAESFSDASSPSSVICRRRVTWM
jgi:hypothetical protein